MWKTRPDLFEGCLHIDPMTRAADNTGEWLHGVPTCKGVVLFADADGRCISMLTAANIRRTAAARLAGGRTDERDKHANIAPLVCAVYYQCCYNDFASALKYLRVAQVLWPESWQSRMSLPRLPFVRIDLSAEWPNFSIGEKISGAKDRRVFGPFPTRKAASQYVLALRTAFAICQRPELIDSPEKAAACPYLQMGACPAPCVGRLGREEYRRQVENAAAAAGGRHGEPAQDLKRRMMVSAAERRFEQAAMLKKRLEAIDLLGGKDYVWTHDLSELAVLHIDRWARTPLPDSGRRKVQTYAGYLFAAGRIHCIEPFTADRPRKLCDAATKALPPGGEIASDEVHDNLALVASFIYRKNPPGMWIDVSADAAGYKMPSPADIACRIEQRFTVAKPPLDEDGPEAAD